MQALISIIKGLIKRAATTSAMKDDGNFSVVQVKYYNQTGMMEVIHPYGYSASAPAGSLALVVAVNGQDENRSGFVNDPKGRFKNLKTGEVIVGSPATKAKIYFKADGSIEIDAPGPVTVNAPTVNVNASDTVAVTTPTMTITGNLLVGGNITDESMTNAQTMASMRAIYNEHTHLEHDITGGPTDPPLPIM